MKEVLRTPPSWEETALAFVNAFTKELNITFIESGLTSREKSKAKKFVVEKYAHPGWNERI
jgi:lipoate-protein ligase A